MNVGQLNRLDDEAHSLARLLRDPCPGSDFARIIDACNELRYACLAVRCESVALPDQTDFSRWVGRAYRDAFASNQTFSIHNMRVAYTAGMNREAIRNSAGPLATTPPVGECTRRGHPDECKADPKVGCVRWRLAP